MPTEHGVFRSLSLSVGSGREQWVFSFVLGGYQGEEGAYERPFSCKSLATFTLISSFLVGIPWGDLLMFKLLDRLRGNGGESAELTETSAAADLRKYAEQARQRSDQRAEDKFDQRQAVREAGVEQPDSAPSSIDAIAADALNHVAFTKESASQADRAGAVADAEESEKFERPANHAAKQEFDSGFSAATFGAFGF